MDLRIPKREVPVAMVLADRSSAADYFLYLNELSPRHLGVETVEEYLNCGVQFIPAKNGASGATHIFNSSQILYVTEKDQLDIAPLKTIIVELDSLVTLTVDHFEPLPAFHARPIDYLNSERLFLTFTLQGCLIHINKNKIIKVSGL